MRKSRLYLSLSIISMIAAVGIGIAQGHCDRYREVRECGIAGDHQWHAYAAFEARDFRSLKHHSEDLINSGDTLNGRRLKAYALRGEGKHALAIAAYHESMHRESGREVPRPLLIDAYIGLADSFNGIGLKERAREWIARAIKEAHAQLETRPDDGAHYQLACVLAVQSSLEQGEAAKELRKQSINQLEIAISKGFKSWDHMRADIDLDTLRGEPEFQALFPR